jgi:Na+/H+ antiporter NhaD/arsenite permease-like protein
LLHLKVSGAFRALGAIAIEHAHAPLILLVLVTCLTGVLSAFLVNDAICLVMAPIVVHVTRAINRNPIPYLIATATASNCGGVATITGNPQNMVIGSLSGISYAAFTAALAPVAVFGLLAIIVAIRFVYREEFSHQADLRAEVVRGRLHKGQMLKALVICIGLGIAFFAGAPVAKAAFISGAILLVTRALKPSRIYREIDGPLLLMFAGLFVVVAGAERVLITPETIAAAIRLGLDDPWRLSAFTAVLSNVVSNVPAVLALKPFVMSLHDPKRAWLIVAMSSTLSGNFTLLGSVANLIVAEQGRMAGSPLSFLDYFKVGLPLTLVTLLAGTAWLALGS